MEALKIFGTMYQNVVGIKATDAADNVLEYIHPSGSLPISENGTVDVSEYASAVVNVPGYSFAQAVTANGISGDIEDDSVAAITSYMCYGRTAITKLFSRGLLSIRTSGMEGCTGLTKLIGTKLNYISSDALKGCTALTAIDMGGQTTSFDNSGLPYTNALSGCSALKTLIIRNANIVTKLNNINNFANTPFASGKTGGTLYVPSALVASYQAANNWRTILGYTNNKILPIEGSIYETQYADGTAIA